MEITVVIGVDMETDIGSWTPFYEGMVNGTPRLVDCMADRGVSGTFFFTGDAAESHPKVVRDVAAAGHEVGCHSLHHETVGESLFPIPGIYPLLPHEVKPRIELATRMVEEALGEKVLSFRSPRLFGGTNVVNALEDLGYIADASYPMYFYADRLLPYHPSREDWTKEGDLRLVEIPNLADMSIASRDEYGRDRDTWPLFRTESAEALLEHVDAFVEYVRPRSDKVCLCFYFHPWEFWDMPQGPIHYGEGAVIPDPFLVKGCGHYAVEQFGLFADAMKDRGAEFLTARQTAERFN